VNSGHAVTTNFSVNFRLSVNNVYGDADDFGSVTVPVSTDIPPGAVSIGRRDRGADPADRRRALPFVGRSTARAGRRDQREQQYLRQQRAQAPSTCSMSAGRLVVDGTDNAETITIGDAAYYTIKIGNNSRTYGLNVHGVVLDAAAETTSC
jgi:hypothetical protein